MFFVPELIISCLPSDIHYVLVHYVLNHVVFELYKVIFSFIIKV